MVLVRSGSFLSGVRLRSIAQYGVSRTAAQQVRFRQRMVKVREITTLGVRGSAGDDRVKSGHGFQRVFHSSVLDSSRGGGSQSRQGGRLERLRSMQWAVPSEAMSNTRGERMHLRDRFDSIPLRRLSVERYASGWSH